ncbi:Putative peptidoglycan binding domain-containing protein [Tenacibaculum sp. MAR_2009_124]|uniref:N-acetylmuramidase domain-containing protein n=1 Tax=Tenacibaculum sp. MAR_2009_124 TaxID=1250059 RepID=UPI0008952638|nr:N-acetylmuramidase family protein [Tenacibaculum sp. MAR_2009_124]SEC20894.1 Putative peptidoglycan binding domain-containing protein [Tenacibaculum sp. MAR_2009_124]
MRILKYRSRGPSVYILEEILVKLGYKLNVSEYFGKDTDKAVREFQLENNLVVDGLVGPKTWLKVVEKEQLLPKFNDKFLSEQDLKEFANENNLELAVVKAVNEVESRGKGFFVYGKPVILFEGHVFWRQLEKRDVSPESLLSEESKDVLYKKWTRKYYIGGEKEYSRLEKAAELLDSEDVREAAYCSASWGAFQIMGYHYKSLGYDSIDDFVSKMYDHEREHLKAFGKFISVNSFRSRKLISWLRDKNWANFARAYNGPGYKENKYDTKLQKAYEKYAL